METILPLLNEAERYLADDDLDRAAELFQRARELDGRMSPFPTMGLARIALALARQDDAKRLLDRVVAQHPHVAQARHLLGIACEAQGQLDVAVAHYEAAVTMVPELGLGFISLARAYAQQGRWTEAQTAAARAMRLLPDSAGARLTAARIADASGIAATALKLATEAFCLAPGWDLAAAMVGDLLCNAQQLDLAAKWLDAALERLSGSALLLQKRAAVAIRQDQTARARACAERLVELLPNNVGARLLAAALATTEGALPQALAHAKAALALDPKADAAYLQLGVVYEAARHAVGAERAYRQATRLSKANWRARMNLAVLLLEQPQAAGWREAKTLLEEALGTAPTEDQALIRYNLTLACLKQGRGAEARQHAREARQPSGERQALLALVASAAG